MAAGLTLAGSADPGGQQRDRPGGRAGAARQAAYWARAGAAAGAVRRMCQGAGRGGCGHVRRAGSGRGAVGAGPRQHAAGGDGAGSRPARCGCRCGGRGQPEDTALLASAAELFVRGVRVDWTGGVRPGRPRWVDLPTYAFQRQRYWPSRGGAAGAVALAGLAAAGHPLLGAVVDLAEGTGCCSPGTCRCGRSRGWPTTRCWGRCCCRARRSWSMVAWAGGQLGCAEIEELTLEAPLVLPERGGVQVQVRVGGPGGDGRREVSVHSRAAVCRRRWRTSGGVDPACQRHPGTASRRPRPADAGLAGRPWPPRGRGGDPGGRATTPGWNSSGYGYGPAFRGLVAAWRRGR